MIFSLLLTNRLVQFGVLVLIAVAGFLTFRAYYVGVGGEVARVEQIERTLETARERIEVENDVRREPDPVERLREQWSRP